MIVVPANSNSIYVSMVSNGCCQSAFDLTYPAKLHGIITPDEYQQSLANINETFKSRKILLIFIAVSVIFILAGMGLFIGGGVSAVQANSSSFPVLIPVGVGLCFLGMMILAVGSCIVQRRQMKRTRAAIAAESMKYSSRSPTPCSWRLDMNHTAARYRRNRRDVRMYHLTIDVGGPMGVYGTQPTYQQNQFNPYPPPYSAQPRPVFCARCGTPRVNPTMAFCGSCGQAFPH